MNKLFESQWKATKEALCEGRDLTHNQDGTPNPNKKQAMATVLENTRRELQRLNEAATAGATSVGNVATLNKVILPVIRRVMPTVIANEIIGVQPMTGPVAQIHTLRVRYADTIPAAGGGVSAGSEALSPFNIAAFYSGNAVVPPGFAGAAPTPMLEGLGGNRLSIQILKEVVEAKTRKLAARWTFEAAQDAQAQQGLDIEAEIMAALAQEIVAEIDQEILQFLVALPGAPTLTFAMDNVTGTPTFVGDVHAALAILINRQANLIAARTRRGAGNWAVVSPTALTVLQSATTSAFARTTEGVFEAPTNTKFVGTLNNAMRVYVNQYASDNTPVLIGYKGNDIDAAAFYCPYVPLTSSGVIIDPQTFEPVVSFLTRYGFIALTNVASSLGNAADYLGTVAIDTASLTFM
jgi:Major capsid protein Gp23